MQLNSSILKTLHEEIVIGWGHVGSDLQPARFERSEK